jgi:urease accessory protein
MDGGGVRASARLEVARLGGRDVLVDIRSEPPLAVRPTGDRVLVAGSAAGPVGGDELTLDVVVGAGARLCLGTVAATIAWPGPDGGPSHQTVRADVAAGGRLRWTPEPLVAVAGCRHRVDTSIRLASGATAVLIDEVSLGRAGEPPGDVALCWRVERDGCPLVHHEERLGPATPGWPSAVTTGRHRHLLAAIVVGRRPPERPPLVTTDVVMAVLPVADDAWVLLAAGASRIAVRARCPAQITPAA